MFILLLNLNENYKHSMFLYIFFLLVYRFQEHMHQFHPGDHLDHNLDPGAHEHVLGHG